jgi:hypothetical protein
VQEELDQVSAILVAFRFCIAVPVGEALKAMFSHGDLPLKKAYNRCRRKKSGGPECPSCTQ